MLKVEDWYNNRCEPITDLLSLIGPTWRDNGTQRLGVFKAVQVTDWSVPSIWIEAWAKSTTLKRLATNQPESLQKVWQAFWRAQLPLSFTEVIHQGLWNKLKTAERLSSWTQYSKWHMCGALETVHHL